MSNIFFAFSFFLLCTGLKAQDMPGYSDYVDFWSKTDAEFKDSLKSPLPSDLIANFDSVPRFDFDAAFRVIADWTPVEKSKPFFFETTGEIKQKYRKVGTAKFTLQEKALELSVYENIKLSTMETYEDYLFIPFTDNSNGIETYGGGRYISLHAKPNKTIVIDFNQSYNPYCVYNDRYSCPVPPEENYLDIAILAGARVNEKK